MPFKRKNQTELTVLSVLLIICILLFSVRIYFIQKASVKNSPLRYGASSVLTTVLKAPRGEILDCYGRQIAVNRDGYNIVFNKAYVKDNLNKVILTLVRLMEEKGEEFNDRLPISPTAPYDFMSEKEDQSDLKRLRTALGLAHYATAQNCFDEMVKQYKLEEYSPEDARRIMGIRYSMKIADFSVSYPFIFAEDISTELMLEVSESAFRLDGVTVEVVPFREYVDTSLAVNLIGSVGPIYEEDWEEYKSKGYSYDDKVGKSGIEAWGEEYLRGVDGEVSYYLDNNGNILAKQVTKEPVAGKTIMLTLDKVMQRSAQDSLQTVVKALKSQGSQVVAGTAVAVRIKDGSVLCAANYPTYDSATMSENWDKLSTDPAKPLTNRAFSGAYPIGSTIKPIVALAAMENQKYNKGEVIKCVQTYDYFGDYKPQCMHYHGNMSLKNALAKSCNYFFFELGRRVGALTLTEYFKAFGLGLPTGVEVGDGSGILVQPESNGFGGDTLQISIGQMNAFTPLQLANYTATLANGGTRYKATLIDKVVSYDMSTVFNENQAEVTQTITLSAEALAAVKEGMLSVTEDGTGRAVLGNYPIKVGGKTGTSQVQGKADHSVFVAFAPFDKPEIAISVVLEHGNSGYSAGTVVRDILNSYFYAESGSMGEQPPFVVLP